MPRSPIPTWFFALAVVRRGPLFLLVHERKHGQGWYLPAGRARPGETLIQAAERETLEEAGVNIAVTGIYRLEHTPTSAGARVRAVFAGEPCDERPPKVAPDVHSLGAAWVSLEEMANLPLRGSEVGPLIHAIAAGLQDAPLDLLLPEGSPWRM